VRSGETIAKAEDVSETPRHLIPVFPGSSDTARVRGKMSCFMRKVFVKNLKLAFFLALISSSERLQAQEDLFSSIEDFQKCALTKWVEQYTPIHENQLKQKNKSLDRDIGRKTLGQQMQQVLGVLKQSNILMKKLIELESMILPETASDYCVYSALSEHPITTPSPAITQWFLANNYFRELNSEGKKFGLELRNFFSFIGAPKQYQADDIQRNRERSKTEGQIPPKNRSTKTMESAVFVKPFPTKSEVADFVVETSDHPWATNRTQTEFDLLFKGLSASPALGFLDDFAGVSGSLGIFAREFPLKSEASHCLFPKLDQQPDKFLAYNLVISCVRQIRKGTPSQPDSSLSKKVLKWGQNLILNELQNLNKSACIKEKNALLKFSL